MTYKLKRRNLKEQKLYWQDKAHELLTKKAIANLVIKNLVKALDKAQDWPAETRIGQALNAAKGWLDQESLSCQACGGTGVMLGDSSAPAGSVLRLDVPCPECQDQ